MRLSTSAVNIIIRVMNACLLAITVMASSSLHAQESGVDYASQSIQLAIGSEPRSLNTTKATDAVSIFFLEHIMEGLLRKDALNQLAPGVAERWEMDGTHVRFWLRKDAYWSDGKPVTAHDFVFAWRTVVNPVTASEYASIMYSVKNAEAINQGKAPLESLGITAVDDYSLEVELESATGYFLKLMTFMVFYPVREDFYLAQNGRYFADVQNMVFNGPFQLKSWIHGASARMEKNPAYWNAGNVDLNVINIPYITSDAAARFNLYKDGKLALENGLTGLDAEQLRNALDSRMRIQTFSDGSVWYIELNHRPGYPTANLNLRKAIRAVLDTQELVYKVIGIPGYIIGQSVVPVYMQGVHDKFRIEYPAKPSQPDLEKAAEFLAAAKSELGLERLPPLALLVDERAGGSLQAEYYQSLFKRTLDIDIKVDAQTFKQRLDKMQRGDFDFVLAGWGPDYEDPMTFLELFASWNPNNHGAYSSPLYDSYIRAAMATSDQQTRMDSMGQAQQLMLEEVAMMPTYERVNNIVMSPHLEGVVFQQTGASVVFTYARVTQ